MSNLIIVSNRLPVTIADTITKTSGGLVSAIESLTETYALKWVGWAGGVVDDPQQQKRLSDRLIEQYGYTPIFLSEPEAQNYYSGFSNASLWPLLHYMSPYARYEDIWYDYYKSVNHLFADTVSQVAQADDMVWVHDYHLMLLPAILKQRHPGMKIGFFLHTPFPSYEIFRCHPNREELVKGLLGADLLGFHTYGYLRHFRSSALRLLGLESEIDHIAHDNRATQIGVYPIGINSDKFIREMRSKAYAKCIAEYENAFQGKKIVLGVERLDYTKGFRQRLDAIDRFLSTATAKDEVVFIFISVPSRENVQAYQTLLETVQKRVSQINGKYSSIANVPIHFIHKSVNFSQLCALYSLADVAMVTPLIDGMNLVAKEYLACQEKKNGVLILSEFAGAAHELHNAVIVNPYDVNQMAQCLKEALSLPEPEKQKMVSPMKEKVLRYDAKHWARSFIRDLAASDRYADIIVDTKALTDDIFPFFSKAGRIAFFLDYDGTISDLKKRPDNALPDEEIKQLFYRLASVSQKHMDVFLVSGRKKEDMDQWFAPYGFNLIAEHGYFFKMHGSQQWQVFDENADLSWMDRLVEILQLSTGTTPGSFVEMKTASVVWHYRATDPELGTWKANQLVGELVEMLSNLPVEIHHGKKIVEVSSIQINKGMIMNHFLGSKAYDAVLCAGDDETDESMFSIADEPMVSIKVGEGQTAAKYQISDPKAFRAFLNRLIDAIAVVGGR